MRDVRLMPRQTSAPVDFVRPDSRSTVALDYLRTDEAWDGRGLRHVSRSAVRIIVPLRAGRDLALRELTARPWALVLAWAATALALLVSVALLLWTALGVRQPQKPAEPAAVEVELGAPATRAPPALKAPAAPGAAKPAALVAAPVPEPAATSPAAPVPDEAATPPPVEPAKLGSLKAVQDAFAKGLDSGTAEPWSEAGLSGFVVVGPSTVAGEAVCRNVAILLKQEGGAGQVVDGQKCLGADGAWADF